MTTAYSSDTTYPADTVLYWRVRAGDENQVGLTWSSTGTFQKKLAVPVASASNAPAGEYLPVWAWGSVQGAASYDISIDQPDGQHKDFSGFRMPAVSFQRMTGTGVFHWRVRAEFPKEGFGNVPGPYSAPVAYTRTLGEPGGATVDSAPDHVLFMWNAKFGVKEYRLELSSRPDLLPDVYIDELTKLVDHVHPLPFAPLREAIAEDIGLEHFASIDEQPLASASIAQIQQVSLLPRMHLVASGKLKKKRMRRVSLHVTGADGLSLSGVTVRVSGAGLKARSKRSSKYGNLSFLLKPPRRGTVLFRATKTGYQVALASLRVR